MPSQLFLQLLKDSDVFLLENPFFQRGEMIDKKDTIKMIDLMLKRYSKKVIGFHFDLAILKIVKADFDDCAPLHLGKIGGNRKAALLLKTLAFFRNNFRVHCHDQLLRLILAGAIKHDQSL